MSELQKAFEAGGLFMWPIFVVSIFVIAILIERCMVLYFRASVSKDSLVGAVEKLLRAGQVDRAIKLANDSGAPLGRVIGAGLRHFGERKEVIQMVMDEQALAEVPLLETRTGYLAMLSNVATLAGLLGTVVGLIHSFGAVAKADAATKSMLLAQGISEAMNCTAFGLLVAVPALIFFAVLQSKTHHLVDEIDSGAVRVFNVIVDVKEGVTSPADSSLA